MLVDPGLIQVSNAFCSLRVLIREQLFASLASNLAIGELCMLVYHPVTVLSVTERIISVLVRREQVILLLKRVMERI